MFFGITAAHAAVFFMIKDGPVIPPQWLIPPPPEPSFKFDEARYMDPVTGEKMVVKEFTIKAPRVIPGSDGSSPEVARP